MADNNKPASNEQEVIDAHYFEDGVDVEGNAPEKKEFEADRRSTDQSYADVAAEGN